MGKPSPPHGGEVFTCIPCNFNSIATPMPIQSVCVYCGSSGHVSASFKHLTRAVATALAEHKLRIIYGGGNIGLMGLLADTALASGGEVVGIIPEHIRAREIQHKNLTQLHVVDNLHVRKQMMMDMADAFVILPGGLGTLDETFEALTWKQLGLHNKPIIIYNHEEFWTPLIALIDHVMASGFVPRTNKTFYKVARNIDELFADLATPVDPPVDPATKWL